MTGDRHVPLFTLQTGQLQAKLKPGSHAEVLALSELIRLQVHHHFNLVQMGLLLRVTRISLLFLRVHVSADSSVHFSHTLSQTQELIQLKTRPTATTGADLLVQCVTVPVQVRDQECVARGEVGRLTLWQEHTFMAN